jgi:hypothetical protein
MKVCILDPPALSVLTTWSVMGNQRVWEAHHGTNQFIGLFYCKQIMQFERFFSVHKYSAHRLFYSSKEDRSPSQTED